MNSKKKYKVAHKGFWFEMDIQSNVHVYKGEEYVDMFKIYSEVEYSDFIYECDIWILKRRS